MLLILEVKVMVNREVQGDASLCIVHVTPIQMVMKGTYM